MKRKNLILATVLTGVLVLSGCAEKNSDMDTDRNDISETVQTESAEETAWAGNAQAEEEIFEELKKVREENPEAYAWIQIDGTDMSFPVFQPGLDLTWYLSHDLYGEEDDAGCIYTEYHNNKDFGDPNTVIYGRNVSSRFEGLHQYKDRGFFDEHRKIHIYTEQEIFTYEVFAAYTYDDRHLLATYDFSNQNIFSSYLADVFSIREMDACIDKDADVDWEDKIITLSTGVDGQDSKRYLVQAVLTEKQELNAE